jgi:hypothetical protein
LPKPARMPFSLEREEIRTCGKGSKMAKVLGVDFLLLLEEVDLVVEVVDEAELEVAKISGMEGDVNLITDEEDAGVGIL